MLEAQLAAIATIDNAVEKEGNAHLLQLQTENLRLKD